MRIVASLTAMLVLAAIGLVPAAAPSNDDVLLAMLDPEGEQALVHVDALTLAPLPGPTLRIGGSSGLRLRSPEGAIRAFADARSPVVRFVDVDRLEVVSTLTVGGAGTVELAAWPTQTRLLGFVYGPLGTELIVLDPVAGKVVARRPVKGSAWPRVALPGGLVYLSSPTNAIRPARLVVLDADGNSRPVVVRRILAGTKWRTMRGVRQAQIRQPGLAADPTGRTAYLVAASGLMAQIELETLGVTYHSVEPAGARRLARTQKSVNGPMRHARWIGEGRIAVSGTDARTTIGRGGVVRETWTPVGVSMIEVGTWRLRMLDPSAGGFTRAPGGLLVAGRESFTAYDLDGGRRFTIPLDEPLMYVQAVGSYAYAWGRDRATTIVDLASGKIVARVEKPKLSLIADEP